MKLLILATAAALSLTACDDGPCPDDRILVYEDDVGRDCVRPAEATQVAKEWERQQAQEEYETQQDDERRTRIADGATREAEDRIREVIREELDR